MLISALLKSNVEYAFSPLARSKQGRIVGHYIKIPSHVIRMVQLKPSSDMNPNLRYMTSVSLKNSRWDGEAHSP